MECSLNKEKIKQGITETAKLLLEPTGLFIIEDNKVIGNNNSVASKVSLTPEQQTKIEESKKYADEVDVVYRQGFLDNPEDFLRHIALQANSSASEQEGALGMAGYELFDLALELFPEEGKLNPEEQAIKDINKEFRDEVILQTSPNHWVIAPSDELAMQYLMAQTGSAEQIMEDLRNSYLSQFSSTSLNLMDENLWLNHPALQDATTQRLLEFAKKINPDFRVIVTDELDQNAVSLIRDNIIFIRQGSIISELPEEISHFFFELLPDDHPLKVEMMEKIVDFPIYLETYHKYKNDTAYQVNSRVDIQKIKREASAKLMGEYIKAAYQNKADEKYGKKRGWLRDMIHKIMKFLRKAFVTTSAPVYSEPEFDINSPFRQAASEIIDKDITSLNLKKIPSIYDSIFFSKVEDEIPEGYEASDIAKSLYEFSQQLKRQVTKTFFTYVKKENMKGLEELLQDPSNKNYNRIWDIINRLDDSGRIVMEMMDTGGRDLISMTRATSALAEAYREMEHIPEAISKVLDKVKNDGTEEQIINNITELQAYFQFSDTFKKITDEFVQLLSFLRENYPVKREANLIYDRMIEKMGTTELRFKVVDEKIMKALQAHIIDVTHKWTDKAFSKYRGEINELHDSLDHQKLKNNVAKLITQRITGLEQIKQAVTGNFPLAKDLMLADGTKVDISKIKDMSQIDYVIFMFSSPTLISDPFISSLMAHFTDKYVAAMVKGQREAKIFADSILPIKKELADMGVGWYEAEEAIQNVQSFYDQSLEDKETKKRVFLSQTNRFDFQYQRQLRLEEMRNAARDIDKLQAEFRNVETTEERSTALKALIPTKQKELQDKRDDYDKFLDDWSHRPFTPEYYRLQKMLKDNRKDTPTLRRWKEINRQLLILEEMQFMAVAYEATINDSRYDQITLEIATLQNEKLRLQDQIPQSEKSTIDALNEIYEVDEVATSRLRQAHKNKWTNAYVQARTEEGSPRSKQQLEDFADTAYEALYTIISPTQEFYDKRAAIFDEINNISRPQVGLSKLADRITELKEKERKLLKPFRDVMGKGEVNVTSFKYVSVEKNPDGTDKMLSESLKELEEEIDMLNSKMRIYSIVLNSPSVKEEEKSMILKYIDLSLAFKQVINNHLAYKTADVQEAFKDLIDLSQSQAEQILSAIKKSVAGDNSEFQSLANLQIPTASVDVRRAFAVMNFDSPQNMMDAENAMYGAFKQFTRRERGQMAESLAFQYQELNDMYSQAVSMQYTIAIREWYAYYQMYVQQDVFNTPDKQLHSEKFLAIGENPVASIQDIETMMGDGVFEAVLQFMMWKERTEIDPTHSYPLSALVDFFLSIHKQKVTFVEGEMYTTWTPISYVRKPDPKDELTKISYPNFLTRNRIKDTFRTEKVYETDPEVMAGRKEANVDINGQWLPLNKKDSPFWNAEYEKLKTAKKGTVEAKQFELLQAEVSAYLGAQVEYLAEGERLDLVIPAKYVDKLEQKKLMITRAEEGWKFIRNSIPFISNKTIEEEEINYLEEINAITAQNRDIYTGAVISEKNSKLRSKRRIALERTTKDATASVAMFLEDVNEYSAKTLVAPIMKSFADVFKDSYARNPYGNKLRSNSLEWLYKTKILDEVPDNAANNPNLAKVLNVVNRLTTFRLLGDPLGALVNLTSGTIQQLVEATFSKPEALMFAKSGWIAKNWLYEYDKDFYKQSSWGLETQLIGVFNMIPDNMEIANHLSKAALLSSVRSKLMAPRQETEKYMAIHMGLAVVMAEPIVFEGKAITPVDLYTLDPVTKLVEIKNEYKSLEKEWNPVNGTRVVELRRRLMQRYTMLQGNFFKQNQSFASTTALGKSAEIMKRWFASGVIRRFQGETVDPFTGETRKGYLLAMANAVGALIYGMRKGDLKYINEYFTKIAKRPSEKKAIRYAATEFLYVAVFGLLAMMVMGYDDDDEDKNKKLREMNYLKQLALLVTLRVQGELGTFIPVPIWGLGYMEMKRAILDPFGLPKASFDNLMGLGALIVMQVLDGLGLGNYDKQLYYQKGKPYGYNFFGAGAFKDKGDSKLKAMIFNTIGYTGYTFEPAEYIKTLTQMQNRLK